MGEVYRATDTKLKREVAIKVLPEDFAADPERLARFEREAQLLASTTRRSLTYTASRTPLPDGSEPPLPRWSSWRARTSRRG